MDKHPLAPGANVKLKTKRCTFSLIYLLTFLPGLVLKLFIQGRKRKKRKSEEKVLTLQIPFIYSCIADSIDTIDQSWALPEFLNFFDDKK